MNNSEQVKTEPQALPCVSRKRVILSMGGKGGVGKTSIMTGLAEWFDLYQIPAMLLDLDTENKARGSLTHFFGGSVPKVNIHTPAGLDAFVDHLADGAPVILADMGPGSGQITYDWFEKMCPDVAEAGIVFTTIGVVTADPASVESALAWAARLQSRVAYLIVENCLTDHADFTYWHESDQAKRFRGIFNPAVIRMDYRLPELENAARNHGVTLGTIASRSTDATELKAESALQEDVDVVGLSILSGAHMALVPRVMELLRQNGQENVRVFIGGIVPDEDAPKLRELGVSGIHGSGTMTNKIISDIRSAVASARG